MYKFYSKFFNHLYTHNTSIVPRLTEPAAGEFAALLREMPGPEYVESVEPHRHYLTEWIEFGRRWPYAEPFIIEFLESEGVVKIAKGIPRIVFTVGRVTKPKREIAVQELLEGRSAAESLALVVPSFRAPRTASSFKRAMRPDIGSPSPARVVNVSGYDLGGMPVTAFAGGQDYMLRFRVASPSADNLAQGDIAIEGIPEAGLDTHWVVTSTDVQFFFWAMHSVDAVPLQFEARDGAWIAQFDLHIPHEGESGFAELAVRLGQKPGRLAISIYAQSPQGMRELYRQLGVDLARGAAPVVDSTVVAPAQANRGTLREWLTPPEHIQASVWGGRVQVTTRRPSLAVYDFNEAWSATDNRLAGPIGNSRASLEKLREAWADHLNDLVPTDMLARLHIGNDWQLHYARGNGWQPLPAVSDTRHKADADRLLAGSEWRNLASDGYTLFDSCFPKGTELRKTIENLLPGSRIDFSWPRDSGPGWVSHVPWSLMYMDPVDVVGAAPPDPERFLGLRFRIGYRAWPVPKASLALGGPQYAKPVHLLYWGDQTKDAVGDEARWQTAEFGAWKLPSMLPDMTQAKPKEQVVRAIDSPSPSPTAVIYFYCHCSVGDGSDPCLRFGNSSQPADVVSRQDLSQKPLGDGPLVFANACATSQADAHMTNLLEDSFFRRGARAFLGTEAKVPVQMASKFAWLYFQFFYRKVEGGIPISAGEALTQARMFLWTQYGNVGGLFYSLVNQYDLFYASSDEVVAMTH